VAPPDYKKPEMTAVYADPDGGERNRRRRKYATDMETGALLLPHLAVEGEFYPYSDRDKEME
jgi:hypothetical protein